MLLLAIVGGATALCGVVWLLSITLGSSEPLYRGKPTGYWAAELTNHDAAIRSRAGGIVSDLILPSLTNQMFSDTNDSRLRLALIDQLNALPGLHIMYVYADGRRIQAVNALGELGPHAKAATPALLEALKRRDEVLCGPAAEALVKVQADPGTVIPLLIDCMTRADGRGRADVVEVLGEYGPPAKAAVPGLVKLLEDRSSKDIMQAVPKALKLIDPDAAAQAGVH